MIIIDKILTTYEQNTCQQKLHAVQTNVNVWKATNTINQIENELWLLSFA